MNLILEEFPLSILEKRKFYSWVKNVNEVIWVTDNENNILYANTKIEQFSKSAFLEKIKEIDLFIPQFFTINKFLTDEVFRLKKIISIENYELKTDIQNVEINLTKIPLLSENQIVGYFSFLSYSENDLLSDFLMKNHLNFVDYARIPVFFINYQLEIKKANLQFRRMFSIKNDEKISLPEVFGKELTTKISSFLSEEENDEVSFELDYFPFMNSSNNLFLHIEKIKNNQNLAISAVCNIIEREDVNKTNEMVLKMYESLLKISTEPMFIYDSENLKFLDVNQVALDFYGFTREQFLRMDLTDLYAPEDIQTLIETSQNEIVKEKFSQPVKHKRADGTTIIVKIIRSEIEYGQKSAFLTIVKNAKENVRDENSDEIVNSVISFFDGITILTDAEGFIEEFSDKNNIMNFSSNEILGKTFISLLGDKFRSEVNKRVFLSKNKENMDLDVEIKSKSDKIIQTKLKILPKINALNEVEKYKLLLKTEVEEKIQLAKSTETESHQLDSSFLSHLFHELLTPINVIVGFSHELSEMADNLNDEQKEFISIIGENQKSLMQLIDSASEYSTLLQNKAQFNIQNFAFVEILDEIENGIKRFAEQKKIDLRFGKVSSSIEMQNDRNRLINLISMLWEFAVRATNSDFVVLSAASVENKVQVSIKDEKSHISEKLLKAFNEFLSADEAIIRSKYGVSRFTVRLFRILSELLNVEYSEKVENGEYIGFVAEIPKILNIKQDNFKEPKIIRESDIEPIQTKHVEITSKRNEILQTQPKPNVVFENRSIKKIISPTNKIDLSSLKCLLMEDQIDSQILFKSQMKEMGKIDCVTRFEDAIPLLRQNEYDFIVMDINLLGEYNGLDAMREIRKMPKFEKIPIIASTAYIMPGDKENYISAGFNDFISKPIMKDSLIACLNSLFN